MKEIACNLRTRGGPIPSVFAVLTAVMLLGTVMGSTDSAGFYNSQWQEYQEQKARESTFLEQTNPLKLYLVMLIRLYQVFVSKQEGDNCQFRPSCSHFGALAIKKSGTIQGLLMTADRLLRCNPHTLGKYPLTPDRQHHRDPVEDHILFSRRGKLPNIESQSPLKTCGDRIQNPKSQINNKPKKDK